MGHGKTKREVLDIVRRTVKKKKEKEGKDFGKCKFNGEGWWQGFNYTETFKVIFTHI